MTITKPKVEMIAIESIHPHPKNTNTHPEAQIAQLAKLISEYGFLVPIIIDEVGTILSGHGRREAAISLELRKVPVIRKEGLTDAQKRAYLIADNSSARNSVIDLEGLKAEMVHLQKMDVSMDLLAIPENMFGGLDVSFKAGSVDDQSRLGEKAPVTCPECGHEFKA